MEEGSRLVGIVELPVVDGPDGLAAVVDALRRVVGSARRDGADVVELDATLTARLLARPEPRAALLDACGGRLGLRVGSPDALAAAAGLAQELPLTHLCDPAGCCDREALRRIPVAVTVQGRRPGPDPGGAGPEGVLADPGGAGPEGVLADPGAPAGTTLEDAVAAAVAWRRRGGAVALTVPPGAAADPAGLTLVAWAWESGVPLLRAGPADLAATALARRIAARLAPEGGRG
jgi:hypothetical protein